MSLLSAIILPMLEKQLIALEPEVAQFVVNQLVTVGQEITQWLDGKGRIAASQIPPAVIPAPLSVAQE